MQKSVELHNCLNKWAVLQANSTSCPSKPLTYSFIISAFIIKPYFKTFKFLTVSIILPLDPIYSSKERINYSTNGHIKFLKVPHYAVVFKTRETACRRPDMLPPTSQTLKSTLSMYRAMRQTKEIMLVAWCQWRDREMKVRVEAKAQWGDSLVSHTVTLTLPRLGVHCQLEPHRDEYWLYEKVLQIKAKQPWAKQWYYACLTMKDHVGNSFFVLLQKHKDADGEPESRWWKWILSEEPQPGFCNRSDSSFYSLLCRTASTNGSPLNILVPRKQN